MVFFIGGGRAIEACNLVFGLFSFKLGSGIVFSIFFYHCTTHFGGNSPPFVQNRPFLPSSFSSSKTHSFANPKPNTVPAPEILLCNTGISGGRGIFFLEKGARVLYLVTEFKTPTDGVSY